jgi:acyl-CoA dehydrogenase
MLLIVLAAIIVIILLAFFRATVFSWLLAFMVFVAVVSIQARLSETALQAVYSLLVFVMLLFGVSFLRRMIVSATVLRLFRKILHPISAAEQATIDAGTVWWDGELFSGHPNWNKMLAYPKCGLSDREQIFMDRQVEQLCLMLNDWDITHNRMDLPPDVWTFMKAHGFFAMSIPENLGGLAFSAQARSAVISKVASRSGTAAVPVMISNSSGVAELLLNYGTDNQKERYLRRLASGQEIASLALTGAFSGSDAAAINDYGIVCRGDFARERDVIGIRLNWEKRYISLAPVATLLALAFKLQDPDHLLGGEVNLGITLALIPAYIEGVQLGQRHILLNSAQLNGPSTGTRVFIPLDFIIGGTDRIGRGWHMMMECLVTGRALSLPAASTGAMKLAARTSGAYCRVRKQFNQPLGHFEGVQEALTRIAANTYMIDAARAFTALAIDLGEKPSVVSAILKYHATERARCVINDAMDVQGGKAICLGEDNYLGRLYQQLPGLITMDGANILTRTLLIFGHGAIRSHPYVLKEVNAAREANKIKALHLFDDALFAHMSFTLSNAAHSFVFGLSNGYGIHVPGSILCRRYYQQLTRFSAAFALSADMAILVLGGSLKHRENLSARLGDVLSLLYLSSATLKRFADDGNPPADLPLLQWALQDALYKIQQAFDGLIQNFPGFFARRVLQVLIFPKGKTLVPPSDKLGHQVATLLMEPGDTRDRLTAGIYRPSDVDDPLTVLEAALVSTLECEQLLERLDAERGRGKLTAFEQLLRINEARESGLITAEQSQLLERDYLLHRRVIRVDDFAIETSGKIELPETNSHEKDDVVPLRAVNSPVPSDDAV